MAPLALRAMQLPPALHARLAGAPGSAEPLPVERDPAARTAPFRFAPRPVRFPREHDFFEVRDPRKERAVVGGGGAGALGAGLGWGGGKCLGRGLGGPGLGGAGADSRWAGLRLWVGPGS